MVQGPVVGSTMTIAHINRIGTAVPKFDVHDAFVQYARTCIAEPKRRAVFDRLVSMAGISRRYAVIPPAEDPTRGTVDGLGLYRRGAFPGTDERMRLYERHAPDLAVAAVEKLDLGSQVKAITHVIVTSCTGMYAPGLDFDVIQRCGLDPSVERTMVGFMGCYAAINGLKLARHIVRSTPSAHVLLLDVELCSLHLQDTSNIEELLSFLVFADGCAASVISAEPTGLAIDRFYAAALPHTASLITWNVGSSGFDMHLSGRVPGAIAQALEATAPQIFKGAGPQSVDRWAVHPGGRSVLDAVQSGLCLSSEDMSISREVLDRHGNMSSATVMFVLESLMQRSQPGERGCAMSFGPGLVAETMMFQTV